MIKNKDNQSSTNKNKEEESEIRKSTTLQIRKKINNNQDNTKPINEKKYLNMLSNCIIAIIVCIILINIHSYFLPSSALF